METMKMSTKVGISHTDTPPVDWNCVIGRARVYQYQAWFGRESMDVNSFARIFGLC